jgi:hypothetical protein
MLRISDAIGIPSAANPMDRRERRRRARERKKMEETLRKESRPRTEDKPATARLRWMRVFQKTVLGTKALWGIIIGLLTLAGGYALFYPHVSVEPGIVLNPVEPFSTAFTIKNENGLLAVKKLDAICWTQSVTTANHIRIIAPGQFQHVQQSIPLLEPLAPSTIGCPAVMGGLGSYAGAIQEAHIEILLSYRQDWWPWIRKERYPFKSVVDSQGGVHWIHITAAEEKIPPLPAK